MRQHVVYILDLSVNLTLDLYVGGGGVLSEFHPQFLSCFNQTWHKASFSEDDSSSNEGPCSFQRGDNSKNTYLTKFENLSSGTHFSILD